MKRLFVCVTIVASLYVTDVAPVLSQPSATDTSQVTSPADKKKDWDVTVAFGPTETVEFTTSEGT